MNAQEFAYWLQGFVELSGSQPTEQQWQQIKDHLQLVFKKVTPIQNYRLPQPGVIPLSGQIDPVVTC